MADLLASDKSHQVLTLADGRKVTLAECGDPNGHPVFFFHPLQGNRLMALTFHKDALRLKLRILAPDRPGIGGSTPQPNRTVRDYPGDVAQMCQLLHVDKFSMWGSSAGTMYALASTAAPETKDKVVPKVTLCPPWLPPSSCPNVSLMVRLSHWVPGPIMSRIVGFTNAMVARRAAAGSVASVMTRSSPAEVAAFCEDPDNEIIYQAMIKEWSRQSPAAFVQEMHLCAERTKPQEIGFTYIEDITAPLRVYMGTADKIVSYDCVKHWADHAPNVELISIPGGTHDGVVHTHKRDGLQKLAQDVYGDKQ